MNILVDNGDPELTNLGDYAMLSAACQEIGLAWPKASLFTFASRPERLAELLPGVRPVPTLGRDLWSRLAALGWFWESRFPRSRRLAQQYRLFTSRPSAALLARLTAPATKGGPEAVRQFLRFLRRVDLYFWCGGGYLTDPFGSLATKLANTLEVLTSRTVPAAAFGLGVGPLHRPRIHAAVRSAMGNFQAVGLRDHDSARQLKEWGIEQGRVRVTGDDALSTAERHTPPDLGTWLGISFRHSYYSGFSPERMVPLTARLPDFCARHRAAMASIPIARADLSANWGLRSTSVSFYQPPFDLASVLDAVGHCRLVVTASYHAAVFALAMGVSVVAVTASGYYALKFTGLQRSFGGLLPVIPLPLPSDAAGNERLLGQMEESWRRAPQVRGELQDRARQQIEVNRRFRHEVFAELRRETDAVHGTVGQRQAHG
ncbi:MAG TPA: polysaccharide pyruvyl transferase family protein [Chthoniobacterales bacterium]